MRSPSPSASASISASDSVLGVRRARRRRPAHERGVELVDVRRGVVERARDVGADAVGAAVVARGDPSAGAVGAGARLAAAA